MRNKEFIKSVVDYYNSHNSTVRETAEKFGISKTMVHHYLINVMPNQCSLEILQKNKSERASRGGIARRNKYSKRKRSQ